MMSTTLAQRTGLAGLTIAPGCRIQIIDTASRRWRTVAETFYTPRHIEQEIKNLGLDSAWVYFAGDRELWSLPVRNRPCIY
jgi:hypothetical protein